MCGFRWNELGYYRPIYFKGITAISLGSGTFDLIIEGDKQNLVELKMISYNLGGEYDPYNKGIIFSENQTKTISRMKFPPIVVAYDYYSKDNYLIPPQSLKREFPIYPSGHKAILYCNYDYFPKAIKYKNLLEELSKYCFY